MLKTSPLNRGGDTRNARRIQRHSCLYHPRKEPRAAPPKWAPGGPGIGVPSGPPGGGSHGAPGGGPPGGSHGAPGGPPGDHLIGWSKHPLEKSDSDEI